MVARLSPSNNGPGQTVEMPGAFLRSDPRDGSRPIAYSSRLGNSSPSRSADAPLMLALPSSAAVDLPARHASTLELTLMVTRPCAVLPLVSVRLQVLDCPCASPG